MRKDLGISKACWYGLMLPGAIGALACGYFVGVLFLSLGGSH